MNDPMRDEIKQMGRIGLVVDVLTMLLCIVIWCGIFWIVWAATR